VAEGLRVTPSVLQLNLLTAFLAAGVVAFFQGTIDRIVVLACSFPCSQANRATRGAKRSP